jgi:hypothetical protein
MNAPKNEKINPLSLSTPYEETDREGVAGLIKHVGNGEMTIILYYTR